jgi:predicted DsbA family dithiol-disulfide isomerase
MMERMQQPGATEAAQKAMSVPGKPNFPGFADAMGMTEFFAARGVSVDQAHACLSDTAKVQAVATNSESWGKSGIDSTPTLLINAKKIEGNTWAELEAALQRAGAR